MSSQTAASLAQVGGGYRKLFGISVVAVISLFATTCIGWWVLPVATAWVVTGLCAVASLPPMMLALTGALVLARHRRAVDGRPDLFLSSLPPLSEWAQVGVGGKRAGWTRRKVARALLAHDLLVGDEVEVLSPAEIALTLGPDGKLDGIEFMAEMRPFCGRRARVFRCLDKIYDYGRTKQMRNLEGFVVIGGFRCDGSEHGGCEAGCYLIWHTRWLRRASHSGAVGEAGGPRCAPPSGGVPAPGSMATERKCYSCQFTQLHGASRPIHRLDPRPDLRALVSGNVTAAAFAVALATRLFNAVQSLRGGVGFPFIPAPAQKSSDAPVPRLEPGTIVRVQSVSEIAATLGPSYRHRGLWFDRDMVKFCGSLQRVERRVERIIDDATGEMRVMKTPCIVLQGVDSTGEFLRFNPQHDPLFWREVWLRPTSDH